MVPVSHPEARTLLVLFVPSVDRDSRPIDQGAWQRRALDHLGTRFGGATAYPKADGVWLDSERLDAMRRATPGTRATAALVRDEPIIVQCWARDVDLANDTRIDELRRLCRAMGWHTQQGAVALVVGAEFHLLDEFSPDDAWEEDAS